MTIYFSASYAAHKRLNECGGKYFRFDKTNIDAVRRFCLVCHFDKDLVELRK